MFGRRRTFGLCFTCLFVGVATRSGCLIKMSIYAWCISMFLISGLVSGLYSLYIAFRDTRKDKNNWSIKIIAETTEELIKDLENFSSRHVVNDPVVKKPENFVVINDNLYNSEDLR